MGRIFLEATAVVLAGATAGTHLNILYEDDKGRLFRIGAGPSIGAEDAFNNFLDGIVSLDGLDFEQGPIVFGEGLTKGEWNGTRLLTYTNGEGDVVLDVIANFPNTVELDLGGRDAEDVWTVLTAHVLNIERADPDDVDYEALLQNSNSAAASLLALVGIDYADYEASLQVFGQGLVSADNYLDFDFSIDGTDGDDIIITSPDSPHGFLLLEEGDQTIIGSLGDDEVDGGVGDDRLDYSNAEFNVGIELGSSSVQDLSSLPLTIQKVPQDGTSGILGTDTATNFETVVGSDFADSLLLTAETAGVNWNGIVIDLGGSGREEPTEDGSIQVDTINGEDFGARLTFDLRHSGSDGLQTVTSEGIASFSANFKNVEAAVGSEFSDTFYGGEENNIFVGNGGDDTVDYSSNGQPISILYAEEDGEAKITVRGGGAGVDLLESIEKIIGTSGFDLLRIIDPITTNSLTVDGGGGQGGSNGQPRQDIINGAGSSDGLVIVIDGSGNGYVSNGGGGQIALTGFDTQIVSSAHDDQITDNSPGDKRIGGGQGDDIISTASSSGDVMLFGGRGSDTLTGGSGNDFVVGNWSDKTNSESFDTVNILTGGSGNDYILSTSRYDFIDAGDGDDYIELHGSTNGTFNNELNINNNGHGVRAGPGDDFISITPADHLFVSDNNGGFLPAPAGVSFYYEPGDGRAHIDGVQSGIRVITSGIVAEDYTLIIDASPNKPLNGFEGVADVAIIFNATGESILLTNQALNFTPNSSDNTIRVTDILLNDIGGSEVGFVHHSFQYGSVDQYRVDPQDLQDAVAPAPEDTQGTPGDDNLRGGRGDDTIDGGDGNDAIMASGGVDTINGGSGNDTVYFFGSRSDFSVSGSEASLVLTDNSGLEGQNTLSSVENVYFVTEATNYTVADLLGYFGTDQADTINGTDLSGDFFGLDGDDVINAGGGNDHITGGLGDDLIDGGEADFDIAYYAGSSADYEVTRLVTDKVTVVAVGRSASDGDDTLTNIERIHFAGDGVSLDIDTLPIHGTSGDDVMVGTDSADTLRGLDGNDTLEGGDGNDLLEGGAGYDVARFGGNSSDYIAYYATNGALTVLGEGLDTHTGIEALYFGGDDTTVLVSTIPTLGSSSDDTRVGTGRSDILYGLDGNDRLFGNAGDDSLYGGTGVDLLVGGNGDDFYDVDSLQDRVIEFSAEGYDRISSSVSLALPANVESIWLSGTSDVHAIGNQLDNDVRGNAGNNLLAGAFGDDVLSGLEGDDFIDGGTGNDTVEYFNDKANYEVLRYSDGTLQITDLVGSDGVDLLFGVETLHFFGGPRGIQLTTVDVSSLPIESGVAPNFPAIGLPDFYSVLADTTLSITSAAIGVLANDSDANNDAISVALVDDVSNGTLTLNADGTFTYTPNIGFSGGDTFSYSLNDGSATTSPIFVEIAVGVSNVAPTGAVDAYTTMEDVALTIDVQNGVLANDNDLDGDALTLSLVGDAANGTLILNADGSFDYSPDANFHGTDSFTYNVGDGTGSAGPVTVTINITAANDEPDAVFDYYTVNEDAALSITNPATGLLANDSDADGDPLVASLVDNVLNGSLALNPDGTFDYTPDPDFFGSDSFTYSVADGSSVSQPVAVFISVAAVNDDPLGETDAYAIAEDQVLSITDISNGVLANDSDVDNQLLTASLIDNVSNGALAFNSDGTFDYTPNVNFNGTDSFSYALSDGTTTTSPIVVDITIMAANDAPTAVADAYATTSDMALSIAALAGVLANDSDIDGDALTATIDTDVSNGTLVLNSDGSFDYTPNAGFSGTDGFTYTASDGQVSSAVQSVTVTVSQPAGGTVVGTSGDDVLEGSSGDDTITGGEGDDVFMISAPPGGQSDGVDTITDFTNSEDTVDLNGIAGTTVEFIQSGSDTSVVIDGIQIALFQNANASNVLRETDFDGSPSSTKLIIGGVEQNLVTTGTQNADSIGGAPGVTNHLIGLGGDDLLSGSGKPDILEGGAGNDLLIGGNSHDQLYGGEDDDTLIGGNGRDHLEGGAGDDILDGGRGDDTLQGDAGSDQFVIKSNFGDDVITDFEAGIDEIYFDGAGFADFAAVSAAMTDTTGGVLIDDGTGNSILLQGLLITDLSSADFAFA